ncbi:nuclear transport factor 2 family protein [Parafrankia elaeagni]|uniref:nuclear transport factor 2 family protein n=1 Tax=Parafrankia elaeagni TaxID=222534 RepID=UPI0003826A46|nr:nuclear transport factor 2 family protein [Parafrankia elaeagni]
MIPNSDWNNFVDRYMASWNEEDPAARRKIIDEIWAEDGTYYNRLFVVSGRDMIENAVTAAHNEYFAKGFSFRSQNDAYGHHGGCLFGWVMVSTATGAVDTFGRDFIVTNADGQITIDYQFGMKPPSL